MKPRSDEIGNRFDSCSGRRNRETGGFRGRHYHRRLSPDPFPSRTGRADVPTHGRHGLFGPPGFADSALTAVPVLASLAFKSGLGNKSGQTRAENWIERFNEFYANVLDFCFRHRLETIAVSALLLLVSIGSLFFIGTEFMPRLDEGSILVETRKLPGISLTDSVEISKRVDQVLRSFPEIRDVMIKIGRPDFATEAMGINEGDTYVLLNPIKDWKRFHSKEELIDAMDRATLPKSPESPTTSRSPWPCVSTKLSPALKPIWPSRFLATITRNWTLWRVRCLHNVSEVRGAADEQMELTTGVAQVSVTVDREALARYGLNVTDVEDALEAAGSGAIVPK